MESCGRGGDGARNSGINGLIILAITFQCLRERYLGPADIWREWREANLLEDFQQG
jgi:hypothetical protein